MKSFRSIYFPIIIAIITALFLGGAASSFAADKYPDAPAVDGTSVLMMDSASGDILYAKNERERRDPASITKILTCLVVLENMDLNQVVTITEDSSPIGMNIAMKKGEKLTVEQLLYAMMLPSANDAARQLALATGGSMDVFCDMMNERAKACGAEDTHFTNPNGLNLPGQEHHKTTAYDLAMITKEALGNDKFRELVSTKKYTLPATNKSEKRVLKSTNFLLYSKKSVKVGDREIPLRYPLATGVKTGTTTPAGNCFVGAALDGDMELIVVTLNSGDLTRFTDAIQLFDYGFDKYDTVIGAHKGGEVDTMRVTCGKTGHVNVGAASSLAMTVEAAEPDESEDGEAIQPEYKYSIQTSPNEKKLTAPFEAGTVVGTVSILDEDGNVRNTVDMITLEGVEEGGPLSHYGIPDDMLPLLIATIITLILIVIVAMIIRKNKKKPAPAGNEPDTEPVAEEPVEDEKQD